MNRNQLPDLCMFCGKDSSFGKMNKEHFAFKGLWAGPRPAKTRTLPAHVSCNSQFSNDNEYFRDFLVMEAGAEQHPEARRILEGPIKRKLSGKRRRATLKKMNLQFVPIYSPTGLYLGDAPRFDVDWSRIERVLNNIIKGIYFTAKGEPLPQDSIIKARPLTTKPRVLEENRSLFDEMCEWQSFGDDVFICRYVTGTMVARITCLMQFYRRRIYFGEAWPKSLEKQIKIRQKEEAEKLLLENDR